MLTRFKVEGFKSLLDVSVDLGAVNVFIGANGSGKSNLLEALGMMGAAVFGSVEPETLRYRGVRPSVPGLYKSSFKGVKPREVISLEFAADEMSYSLGLSNPTDAPENQWSIRRELLKVGEEVFVDRTDDTLIFRPSISHEPRELLEGFEHRAVARTVMMPGLSVEPRAMPGNASGILKVFDDLENFAIFAPSTSVLRGTAGDVARAPLGLEGSGLSAAIQKVLNKEQQTLGPFDLEDIWELVEWTQDMAVVPGSEVPLSPAVPTTPIVLKFVDRFMSEGRNTLSGYDASEGALYVLFLLALVGHPRAPHLFAIDNFDHALHPRLASRLIRMVTQQMVLEGQRQMLMTTHNPLVLDGLDLRDSRIRLFAVERDPRGATQIRRIELSEELLQEAERGVSLSRLWVMGRLGAVPRSL